MITTFLLILVLPISTVAAAQQVYTTIITAISTLIPPSMFSLDYNCVTIDCYKEGINAKCEEDYLATPMWLDCYSILRCLDFSELSVTYCATGADDYSGNSNNNDDCCRLTKVVLEPCKDMNATLPAPPECARMILL